MFPLVSAAVRVKRFGKHFAIYTVVVSRGNRHSSSSLGHDGSGRARRVNGWGIRAPGKWVEHDYRLPSGWREQTDNASGGILIRLLCAVECPAPETFRK